MNRRTLITVLVTTLTLLGLFFVAPRGLVGASPLMQMTPGVDPMSVATVAAPTAQPGTDLDSTTATSGQSPCPMMNGSTTGGAGMSGMTGMGTGMQGMQGMGTGMQGMQGMAQSGNMAQMGNMPMAGSQVINDALYNRTLSGWFYSLNPWWILGWLILLALAFGLLALIVLGIVWLVRQLRKDKPAPAV